MVYDSFAWLKTKKILDRLRIPIKHNDLLFWSEFDVYFFLIVFIVVTLETSQTEDLQQYTNCIKRNTLR